jgi:hypothetical protein
LSNESLKTLEITLDRAREDVLDASQSEIHISTDEELRAYAKENGFESLTAIRFEEMHQLLKEAELLTEDEYRSGPNYSTLTAAAGRILALRARIAN